MLYEYFPKNIPQNSVPTCPQRQMLRQFDGNNPHMLFKQIGAMMLWTWYRARLQFEHIHSRLLWCFENDILRARNVNLVTKSCKKTGYQHAVHNVHDLILVWKFPSKSRKKLGTNMPSKADAMWILYEDFHLFCQKDRVPWCFQSDILQNIKTCSLKASISGSNQWYHSALKTSPYVQANEYSSNASFHAASHHLRRGLRVTNQKRNFTRIPRPRNARSPQRVARDKSRTWVIYRFAWHRSTWKSWSAILVGSLKKLGMTCGNSMGMNKLMWELDQEPCWELYLDRTIPCGKHFVNPVGNLESGIMCGVCSKLCLNWLEKPDINTNFFGSISIPEAFLNYGETEA